MPFQGVFHLKVERPQNRTVLREVLSQEDTFLNQRQKSPSIHLILKSCSRIYLRFAQHIDEQPVRTGDTGRQLPEKCQRCIHKPPFAILRGYY